MNNKSANFSFLESHAPHLSRLGMLAERYFIDDPNTSIMKVRQFAEIMAQFTAAHLNIAITEEDNQYSLLKKFRDEGKVTKGILDLFHHLRKTGNKAVHELKDDHGVALTNLKIAHRLANWYHLSFGRDRKFTAFPFTPPTDPVDATDDLKDEIEALRNKLDETLSTAQQAEHKARVEEEKRRSIEDTLSKRATLNDEVEKDNKRLKKELGRIKKEVASQDKAELNAVIKRASDAAKGAEMDEADTRRYIDSMLRVAGWEVDSDNLTYKSGARPQKGKNRAISEWPTIGGQSADYVLFAGLIPIGVVEAKKRNINVAGKITQAERYAKGFKILDGMKPAWNITGDVGAWTAEDNGDFYQIPFVYSCNGRDLIKQDIELSGTWFRDVRHPSNLSDVLNNFHSPEGLLDKLERSKESAQEILKNEGFNYLKLREYQVEAIQAVEASFEKGKRSCLLAMATGTGKTRTILGLMYRFLKAERFNRILFLVDRRTLGKQATDEFKEVPLEQNLTLAQTYHLAELGDMAAEAETRIHVATVQSMVKRIFQSDTPPSVSEYDCIIVDEAHRGYTLDQEMTDGEISLRDQELYLSSYRRVVDYFDSVKVALTATPAKHTTDIFGKPVYTYTYSRAVAEDYLIDQEPPITYDTLLKQKGIHFKKGTKVSVINTKTQNVEIEELEDDLDFKVDAFNKQVITEPFNKVICEQLALEFNPFGEEKTLIFCATDKHADMVKRLLDHEFKELYGEKYNKAAVAKITGASDKVDTLIKSYKINKYPNIAITVDLLTTGVDVPKICNLVFLRRVRSRILYEQMKGRATRRCDEIGKTVYRIFDPVGIYEALQPVDTMKPIVKNPNITLDELVDELADPRSHEAPGNETGTTHAHDVLNQVSQKVMRVLRKAQKKAEKKSPQQEEIKSKLSELEDLWGVKPSTLHTHLREMGPKEAVRFLQKHSQIVEQLAQVKELIGTEYRPVISDIIDEFKGRTQKIGDSESFDDYLESFTRFIENEVNKSAALSVVVNRPKDLTRKQLADIRLHLSENGFSEVNLNTAWKKKTNQKIAENIISYIRQAAMKEELVPFQHRVENAMTKIYAMREWTPVQQDWLQRLAKQIVIEIVVDEQFVNKAFAMDGGVKMLNKVLGGELDTVIDTVAEHLWDKTA